MRANQMAGITGDFKKEIINTKLGTTILAKRFWDTSPFHVFFYGTVTANLRYTLNTALTRFFPHPPEQS